MASDANESLTNSPIHSFGSLVGVEEPEWVNIEKKDQHQNPRTLIGILWIVKSPPMLRQTPLTIIQSYINHEEAKGRRKNYDNNLLSISKPRWLQEEKEEGHRRMNILYTVKTICLFTLSDLKTIVFPSTLFAIILALSSTNLTTLTILDRQALLQAGLKTTRTAFWTWINLLPFDIDNQRQPESIEEDGENKPWRPIPAGRIAVDSAVSLMRYGYITAAISSLVLGGLSQCIALMVLGFWYNDLNGADSSFAVRNLINAAGYMCFTSGAAEVMLQKPISHFEPKTLMWVLIIGAVILTSIHAQDIPDQAGDQLRSRKTVPLVIGDGTARWALAVAVTAWSYGCPAFWSVDIHGFVTPVLLGAIVSVRFLIQRTVEADEVSFRLYNLWIIALYFLPLIKSL